MSEAAVHRLVPEAPDVVPTVGVEAVWRDVVAAIERCPGRDWLFANYGEKEVATGKKHTDRLRVQETAVAILNICLRHNLFTPRIHFEGRFYKVPADAFVPRSDPVDGVPNADATTWSKGVLHRLDTTVPFEWIADGGFALLLTGSEFDVVRKQLHVMIAEAERDQRIVDRDRILVRAINGEIGAREAEAEAKRLGLDALESRPARDSFDPRQRAAWTFPMVLAWIAWRDYGEVRAWDSDYRQECLDWTTSDGHPDGRRLVRRKAATVFEFEVSGYLRWAERESGFSAREFDAELPARTKKELWRALQEGLIVSNGVARAGKPRQDIPAIEWEDLRIYRNVSTGREYFAYRHARTEAAYDELRVPRAQVIACWPELAPNVAGPAQTNGTETRVEAALAESAGQGREPRDSPTIPRKRRRAADYIRDPAVVEAAKQRLTLRGDDPDSEREVRDEIVALAGESGFTITLANVNKVRNEEGHHIAKP